MFDCIKYVKLEFNLLCEEKIYLNKYKGSALRGGFGHVFKKITCSNKECECKDCHYKENCAYAYIFKGVIPNGKVKRSATVNMPVPFVIEPPMDNRNYTEEGEILKFGLVLIGKAIEFLPYFIFCFEELGKVGLGRSFGKYKVLYVKCVNSEKVIYFGKNITLNQAKIKDFGEIEVANCNKIFVEFLTPFRALKDKKVIKEIFFEDFIKNLLRRISLISHFHCDNDIEFDYSMLLEKAREVQIESSNLKFFNWERIASNTKKQVHMGGYTGIISYEGGLELFIPLLKIGEIFHVGKGCSFGMGKYEISQLLI